MDVRRCAVNAVPVDTAVSAHVLRRNLDYPEWALLELYLNGRRDRFAIDVSVSCQV